VLPSPAERALAPFSPPSCGIFQSPIAWAIGSIENPHLSDEPGAIIAFPGKTFGLKLWPQMAQRTVLSSSSAEISRFRL